MRSRLQWAGHVERMADERLPKRAIELREQGRRRRGRPRLRWEDCIKSRAGTNTPSDEYDTYRDTGWRIRYVSRIHFFSEAKLGNG